MSDLQKEIFARLDAIAAKLGVAVSALWALYVRQAKINGIEFLVVAVVVLGFSIYLFRLRRRFDAHFETTSFVFTLIGAILLLIVGLCFAVNALDLLANPGYWAFRNLLGTLS